MERGLITCIMPVFNGELYLREALDSILAQTYRPLEIIVVDDGSTDGTARIATGYSEPVRYLWKTNGGPPTARNLGLSKARGEFIAFLDADDLWRPQKLRRQVDCFNARPELHLCVTHLQNFCIPELCGETARFKNHHLSQSLPGYVLVTMLVRRSLFETVGLFNPSLRVGDDTDWILRAAEGGAVMELLTDILVYRRLHHSNLSMESDTRNTASPMQNALLRVVKASLDRRRFKDEVPQAYAFPASDWRKEK